MVLDATTLIVVTSLVALVSAFALSWVLGVNRERGVGLWTLSLVLTAVATGMLAARGIQASPGLVALRTGLFGLSYGLRYAALCMFFAVPARPALVLGPALVEVALTAGLTGQPLMAIALVDVARFLQNALLVQVVVRNGRPRRNAAQGLMIAGLAILALVFALRGGAALVDPRTFSSLARTNGVQSGTWLASLTGTILSSFALLLMYRQRATDDLAAGAARLAEALGFNRSILLESPLPIGVYEAEGRCVLANDALAGLIGTTREQAESQDFRTIASWKRAGLLDDALAALGANERRERDAYLETSFGRKVWVHYRMLPTHLNGRRHLLVQFVDLTAQRQQEMELRARKDELEATLARRRRLEGLLPICMHCKKIHVDERSWQQVEKYVSDNSDARFSHGICPECARALYPGLEDEASPTA